jgi:cellulose biosynthesis protein BcsQ
VLVDTPPALAETVLAAFDLSDLLYVMATLDLPSVRNMSVFLSTLERLRIPTDNLRLVLNKAESDVGIDIEQVTKLFPQGFESDAALRQGGEPVHQPRHAGDGRLPHRPEISRLMAGGMKNVLPADLQTQVSQETAPKKAAACAACSA